MVLPRPNQPNQPNDPVIQQMLQSPPTLGAPQLPPGAVNLDQILSGSAQAPGGMNQIPQSPTIQPPTSIVSPLDTGTRADFGQPQGQTGMSGTGDPDLDQMMGMTAPIPLYPTKRPEINRTPKPGKSYIQTMVAMDTELFSETLTRMARDVAMFRQHTSGKPLGLHPTREREVRMANLSNLVNKLSNMFSGTKAIAEAPYDTTDEEKSSQRIENAFYYMRKKMKQEYAKRTGGNLQRDEYFYSLLHGRICYRALPDLEDPEFPFNVALMDPATCFPTFGEGKNGMLRMVRKYKATVGAVVTAYGGIDPKLQMKIARKLGYEEYADFSEYMNLEGDVIEYYDRWWRYVEFQGQEVIPVTAHEYGFVPFVYVMATGEPAGMLTPAGGYVADWRDPDDLLNGAYVRTMQSDWVEKGVSVFHYLRSTHRLREALNTLLYNEVEKATNPATITYTAPHLLNKEYPPLDVKRGGTNVRAMGMHDVQGIPTSPRPTDFTPLYNNLDMSWMEGSLPPGAFGGNPGANVSGVALDQLMSSAKDLALPYIVCWQNAQSLLFEELMMHYRDRISPAFSMVFPAQTKGGSDLLKLTVDDLMACGVYLDVRVTGIDDANQAAKIAAVNQAIQAGLFSQRHGMEELDIEDPDRMFQDILAEKAMQHPLVMQNLMIPSSLAARGDEDLLDVWLSTVVIPSIPQMADPAAAGGGGGGGGDPMAALMGGGGGGQPPSAASQVAPPGTGGNGSAAQQMGGQGV